MSSKTHFKVKKITDFRTASPGQEIPESDYSLFTSDDKFIQFELVREDDTLPPFEVKPGIYSVGKTMAGYTLNKSSFTEENLLDEYIHTKNITDKINKFFGKLDVYKKYGIEVPKRGFLLYGPPGCGKSVAISKVCKEYANTQDTIVLIWHTDKFDPGEIKDFIKSFNYVGVNKMILVAEDIGGTEIDEVRMRSDSSLLSLLDNVEKTFTIPTLILATTNHPEIFLGNLTNRPQRFDQCIEVKPPVPEFRSKFLQFFTKGGVSEEVAEKISLVRYNDFSIAHIKEVIIRSEIEDITLEESMEQIASEIERYKKNFTNKKSMSMGL